MMSVKTVVSSVSQSIVSTTIQKVGVSLSLRGSLSLPLAVVHTVVAKTVVAKTVAVSPQSTIQKVGVSLSLGGSLSLPLAVVVSPVSKTVSTVVSSKTVSVSQSVSSVAIEVRIGSSLCLGFRLGGSDGRQGENYEHLHVGAG